MIQIEFNGYATYELNAINTGALFSRSSNKHKISISSRVLRISLFAPSLMLIQFQRAAFKFKNLFLNYIPVPIPISLLAEGPGGRRFLLQHQHQPHVQSLARFGAGASRFQSWLPAHYGDAPPSAAKVASWCCPPYFARRDRARKWPRGAAACCACARRRHRSVHTADPARPSRPAGGRWASWTGRWQCLCHARARAHLQLRGQQHSHLTPCSPRS